MDTRSLRRYSKCTLSTCNRYRRQVCIWLTVNRIKRLGRKSSEQYHTRSKLIRHRLKTVLVSLRKNKNRSHCCLRKKKLSLVILAVPRVQEVPGKYEPLRGTSSLWKPTKSTPSLIVRISRRLPRTIRATGLKEWCAASAIGATNALQTGMRTSEPTIIRE